MPNPCFAKIEEFDIRVKKIRREFPETSKVIFDAAVLEWRPRRKEWSETRQVITCIGYYYGLVVNDHLHVKAEEFEDPMYGLQWQIYLSERVQPGTELELIRFLTSIKGIGPKIAERLVQEFSLDTLDKVTKDPSSLNRLGLPQAAKDALYNAIVENQAYEQLLVFLRLHGVQPGYTIQIYEKYGSTAIEKIRDNPYSLYLDDVIDFPAAAKLDHELGGNTRPLFRVSASILACLRENAESAGNLFISRSGLALSLSKFMNRVAKITGTAVEAYSEEEIEDAMKSLFTDNLVVQDGSIGEDPAIYLTGNYRAEQRTAKRIYELSNSVKRFYAPMADIDAAIKDVQAETKFNLADEQAAAIRTALSSPISILTGGPGTGKTQTLTMLVKTTKKLVPTADIRICAPTGKAAVRAQELTNMPAATIHRMIGYPKNMLETDELICDLVIADEFSMSDIQLCAWLFNAVWSGARVVIVGDHEQLPSVGPGLVLRDMIDSEVIPVTRLRKIFRQSGTSHIVTNAHAVINTPVGTDVPFEYSDGRGGDFYFIDAPAQSKILRMVKKSVRRMLDEGFPLEQIEVLSPIHGGLIGSDNLNAILQDLLNPGAYGYQLKKNLDLRVGDKVIHTKNNYDLNVFNGETGIIKAINYSPSNAVLVSYPHQDVWYDAGQAEDLDLAYAITTHRAQGSEFHAVIIPIHEALLYSCNRNLMYTAITRAKKRVVLIGSRAALQTALMKRGAMERNSNLILRLQTMFFAPDAA